MNHASLFRSDYSLPPLSRVPYFLLNDKQYTDNKDGSGTYLVKLLKTNDNSDVILELTLSHDNINLSGMIKHREYDMTNSPLGKYNDKYIPWMIDHNGYKLPFAFNFDQVPTKSFLVEFLNTYFNDLLSVNDEWINYLIPNNY
jgi:hypothetical protein